MFRLIFDSTKHVFLKYTVGPVCDSLVDRMKLNVYPSLAFDVTGGHCGLIVTVEGRSIEPQCYNLSSGNNEYCKSHDRHVQ